MSHDARRGTEGSKANAALKIPSNHAITLRPRLTETDSVFHKINPTLKNIAVAVSNPIRSAAKRSDISASLLLTLLCLFQFGGTIIGVSVAKRLLISIHGALIVPLLQ